jgi:hypothetical protein
MADWKGSGIWCGVFLMGSWISAGNSGRVDKIGMEKRR